MKSIASIMLSLSSFSGVIICYLLARGDSIATDWVMRPFIDNNGVIFIIDKLLVLVFFIILARISIKLSLKYFSNTGGFSIVESKPMESVAIPTYVGLFVIAVEIANMDNEGRLFAWLEFGDISALFLLVLLFILWRKIEKIIYFNPVWLVKGYRFYEIRAADGNSYTLITNRDDMKTIKKPVKTESLIRINNYTYMEAEKT